MKKISTYVTYKTKIRANNFLTKNETERKEYTIMQTVGWFTEWILLEAIITFHKYKKNTIITTMATKI